MWSWRPAFLLGIVLLGAGWFPWSQSPGIDGKFLAMYLWGLLLLAYLISQGRQRRLTVPANMTLAVLIGMILAGTIFSAVLSGDWLTFWGSGTHREGVATTIFYILTFLVFAQAADKVNIRDLGAALIVAVAVNGLIGFSPAGIRSAKFFGGRFVGTFAEPSFVAAFLVLALPIIAYTIVTRRSLYWQLIGPGLLLFTVFSLIVSRSRAGYLAFFAMVCASGLLYLQNQRKKMVYALPVLLLLLTPLLSQRFSPASLIAGVQGRISTWKPALLTGKYILAGAGPDQFRALTNNRFNLWATHNTFINEAADSGWAAALAFLVVIIIILVLLGREIRQGGDDGGRAIALVLFAAIFGYTVFCLGNYTRPYVNILFWILLGLAAGRTIQMRDWRPRPTIAAGVTIAALVFASLILVFSVRFAVGSYHYWTYINVEETASISEHWDPLDKAASLEPTNDIFRKARAVVALELLKTYPDDPDVLPDIRRNLVADWEFLYADVYNDTKTYARLTEAYGFAGVPRRDWLTGQRD